MGMKTGWLCIGKFWNRLGAYQKILEPARGVSRVRLGAYQAPGRFFREAPPRRFFDFVPYSYRRPIMIRIRIGA